MNSKKLILSSTILFFGAVQAQKSAYINDQNAYQYDLAENLFQTKTYRASQYYFAQQFFYKEALSRSKKEATLYFDSVIDIILQNNHGEEHLAAFINQYPDSAFFAQANMPLADYYLVKKEFVKALETLQKVSKNQLSENEKTQYIMKLGYAKFMTGDSKGALSALKSAYQDSEGEYKNDIAYMLGHLYYADHQNEKAFSYFDVVKTNPKFESLVRPYYVQLFFNEKQYDKAIQEGISLLNFEISEDYKAEVHKIIGESYFMKGSYAEAHPHLEMYLEKQQNPSDSDLYEMGFVCSKLKKFDEAVSYYNRLINTSSAMSQNAYYQLGNAYLETNKKQEALSAFRSSYQMDYDAYIQELSMEQYAKLGYEIGNPFESAPAVIQKFIATYPNSTQIPEMEKLLVKSFLYSGNYKQTLAAIDNLKNKSSEIEKVDQEVSFLLGTEEFNKDQFMEAGKYFKRSLTFNYNKEFYHRAMYWLGQTYYQTGNYAQAVDAYLKVMNEKFPEKQQLHYDLGYAYFKDQNFEKAQMHFSEYLKYPSSEYAADAELRLADTYYAVNKLDQAIAIYEKNQNASDYTVYQKGLALGFKGEYKAKIATLKSLLATYPNSEYGDDASYEIGSAYALLNDFKNSNDQFSKVIRTSTDKELVANASIYRAQNYFDMGDDEKALVELQSLAHTYRNTAYINKIVQASAPIFSKSGDVEGYENFARNNGVQPAASEVEEINLNAAKSFFVQKNYLKAIPLYEKYLAGNPKGENWYQAQFELGESYFQTQNVTKALVTLQDIAGIQNEYQEDAQTRMAQILLAQNKTSDAKIYLEKLANSENASVKNFANVELMKMYSKDGKLPEAENYANAVLANSKNSKAVQEAAKVIVARSLMSKGKDKEAQTSYSNLEKSSNAEVAAESLFAKAYYQNKAKAYKSSNETIFKLANNYSSEEYWGAKALVIMAKNYLGLKDAYQASYTCDEIIANYQDFPDVVAEAKEVKSRIK